MQTKVRGHNAARSGTGEIGFQRRSTSQPDCSELGFAPAPLDLSAEHLRVARALQEAMDDLERSGLTDDADWFVDYRIDGSTTDTDDLRKAPTAAETMDAVERVDIDDCRSYGNGLHTVAVRCSHLGDVVEVTTFDLRPQQMMLIPT